MKTNVVDLEILNNRFTGIVSEMGRNIWRSSFTPFVKDAWDFGMGLVTPSGEMFAYSKDIGVGFMVAAPFEEAVRAVDDLQPGDVVMSNDPYTRSGGLASHLPDLNFMMPYFYDGELVCYIWTFIHSTDIGGMAPGSISPTAVDIYQEGLRIPPVKLFKQGEVDQDLMDLFLANSRIPTPNKGDVYALYAAMRVASQRITDTIDRYGRDTVQTAMSDVLDYAETFSRAIISDIPDGTYRFHDYIELDVINSPPARISVAATVSGSDLSLDFTGTDPQVQAAYNLTTFGRNHHFLTGGLAGFFLSVRPEAPLNKGLWRPISIVIPEGTLLTPELPAAVGVRGVTAVRTMEIVNGALSLACDGGAVEGPVSGVFPAASSGITGVLAMSVFDETTGERLVNVVSQLGGGSGARPHQDGIDGSDLLNAYRRNIPVEVMENEVPAILRHCRLRGPAAPGKWRGGHGLDIAVEATAPNTFLIARNWERSVFRPWGRAGGEPGALSEIVLDSGTAYERRESKIDVLRMQPGETVQAVGATGAGFGDPFDREPLLVLADLENDWLTRDQARDLYGVEITEALTVDLDATAALRDVPRSVPDPRKVSYGPEREAFERAFPTELHDEVLELLQDRVRAEQRHYYLQKLFEVITTSAERPGIEELAGLLPRPVGTLIEAGV